MYTLTYFVIFIQNYANESCFARKTWFYPHRSLNHHNSLIGAPPLALEQVILENRASLYCCTCIVKPSFVV